MLRSIRVAVLMVSLGALSTASLGQPVLVAGYPETGITYQVRFMTFLHNMQGWPDSLVLLEDWAADGGFRFRVPGSSPSAPFYTGPRFASLDRASFGDIKGDGADEVVFGGESTTTLFAFDQFGNSVVPGFPASLELACPFDLENHCLADLDGDGALEIVAPGHSDCSDFDTSLHVIRADGTPFPGFPVALPPAYPVSGLAVGDLDFDGDLEIVVSATLGIGTSLFADREVFVFEHDGTVRTGWPAFPAAPGEDQFFSVAIVDLDNDGFCEIVGKTRIGVVAMSHDGQTVASWQSLSQMSRGIAIADLDGDDDYEIVVTQQDNSIVVVDHEMQFITRLEYSPTLQLVRSLSIADVDGDGDSELGFVAVTGVSDYFYVYSFDSTTEEFVLNAGFPIVRPRTATSSEARRVWFLDSDGDGDLELGFLSWYQGSLNGTFLYELDGEGIGRPQWGGYQGTRTGSKWLHEGQDLERFVPGDGDASGTLGLGDVILLLRHLQPSPPQIPCERSLDVNSDGAANLFDLLPLLNMIFRGTEAPRCRLDPSSSIPCDTLPICP